MKLSVPMARRVRVRLKVRYLDGRFTERREGQSHYADDHSLAK